MENDKTLTPRQAHMFDLIAQFIKTNGYSPTVAELAKVYTNEDGEPTHPMTAHEVIATLKRKGYIDYAPNKARTIRIRE